MQIITTIKDFKKAIRKAKAVYAGVLISSCDPTYVQVVKSDLLFQIEEWQDVDLSFCRLEEDNCLYIN